VRIAVVVVAILALAGGVAYADQTIYAAPESQFVGGDITIAQGEKVTFTNADTVAHDVTALGKGSDGKALFASATTGPGQSNAVVGTEYLTTGTYQYECSIHTFMKGTITVSSSGTPAQRPGSPPPSQPQPAGSNSTAPALSVKVLDTKRSAVRKRRSLQLSVTTSEASSISFTASSGKTTVASGNQRFEKSGTRKVSIKLTKTGLRLVKRSKALTVTVSARASDGATASAGGKLR
jgi:plastocyanin